MAPLRDSTVWSVILSIPRQISRLISVVEENIFSRSYSNLYEPYFNKKEFEIHNLFCEIQ